TGNCLGAVLEAFPVLLEVEEVSHKKVKLVWHSSQVDLLDHIYLQRSHDGNRWEDIHRQDIIPNKELLPTTTLWDSQPREGVNYYRMAYQRKDGQIGHSHVVSAQVLGTELMDVVLLSHPSEESKLQAVGGSFSEGTIIKLRDLNGRAVWQRRTTTSDTVIELPSITISGGMYLVEVETSQRTFLKKWIKN
ncbi:MAG: T9SS type A sorting domain-containing protein, partial [Bacteroidota bacterium]